MRKIDESMRKKILDDFDLINYVKQKGVEFKGQNICCIFHNEKKPSLQINKNGYKCHSCGVSGGELEFLAKFHNISNAEAWQICVESYMINNGIITDTLQKPKENKYLFRLIANNEKRHDFIVKDLEKLTTIVPDADFCQAFNKQTNKHFTIDGMRRAGVLTAEGLSNLNIGLPFTNFWNYETGKNKTLIVEGMTDYISCLSNDYIINNYNVISRRTVKTAGILTNTLQNFIICDPDDDIEENIKLFDVKPEAEFYFIKLIDKFAVKDISDFLAADLDFKNIESKFTKIEFKKPAIDFKPFWDIAKGGVLTIKEISFFEVLQNKGFYSHVDTVQQKIEIRQIKDNIINDFSNQTFVNYCSNDFIEELPQDIPHPRNPAKTVSKTALKEAIMKNTFINTVSRTAHLKIQKIEMNRDTIDTSFFYFPEKVAAISAGGIELLNYKDLPNPVHNTQILKPFADFELLNPNQLKAEIKDFYYYKFLRNICTNPISKELDNSRFQALQHTIGYLLHKRNLDNYQKMIILTETNVTGKADGGTGKGILSKSLKHFNNIVNIDGKAMTAGDQFIWDEVSETTNTIILNDVLQNFNFEKFYNVITDGLSVNQKGKRRIFIQPEHSPKILTTTNYAINASTGSSRRRRYELEIYQYYSEKFSPFDDFGKMIYSNFSKKEWNLFYNMYLYFNLKFMKTLKIPEYQSDTAVIREFVSKYSLEVYEFLKAFFEDRQSWITLKRLCADVNTYFGYTSKYEWNPSKAKKALVMFGAAINKKLETMKGSDGSQEVKYSDINDGADDYSIEMELDYE